MPRREQTVSVSAFLLTALLSHNFVSCSHAAPADEPQCRLGKEKCAALLGDGGWASAYDPGLYTSRCNIPRVELEAPLSADDFRAQFEHQAVRSLPTNSPAFRVGETEMASALSFFPLEPLAALVTTSNP